MTAKTEQSKVHESNPTCAPSPRYRRFLRFLADVRPMATSWQIWLPLLWFVVPTVVIGYGIVMPRHGILGVPELTLGFGSTVVGACLTYLAGVRVAWALGARSVARGDR